MDWGVFCHAFWTVPTAEKKFSFATRVLMGSGAGTVFGMAVWMVSQTEISSSSTMADNLGQWFGLVAHGYLSLFLCVVVPIDRKSVV